MSQAPAMPVFTDALIGDTTHLTTTEFGAYCLLLFVTWRNNGQPLPDDDKRLARVCRMTQAQWAKVRGTLAEFFDLSGDTWRQKRLEKEWNFVAEKSAINRENGKRGGRRKSLNNNEPGNANGSNSDNRNGIRNESTHTHTHTHTHTQEVKGGGGSAHATEQAPATEEEAAPDTDPEASRLAQATEPGEVVARRFLELRSTLWPNCPNFPAPTSTLIGQARAYLTQGGTVSLLLEVIERGMRTAASQGKTATVSLKAFHLSLSDAIAGHCATITVQGGSHGPSARSVSSHDKRVSTDDFRAALAQVHADRMEHDRGSSGIRGADVVEGDR